MKLILIIAYQFCPRGRIGTRRWSKFAKTLARDHMVHVIAAKYPYKDEVTWCHDVADNPQIKIHHISAKYPSYAIQENRNFLVKSTYHLLKSSLYYQDEAQYWGGVMNGKAAGLIQEYAIKDVIITGLPFSPMHHIIKLRKRFPDLNVILDLRDPWMQIIPRKFGKLLSKRKHNKFLKMEKEAFDNANKLLFVTEAMTEMHKDIYPMHSDKMFTIYNGFDKEDFNHITSNISSKKGEKIKIAYAGSMHIGRTKGLELLVAQMYEMDSEWWSSNLEIDVYTNQYSPANFENANISEFFLQVVNIKSPLSQKDLFHKLMEYDVLFTINDAKNAFAFGTKFFEYLALEKPILLISPKGEQYDLLKKNNQYVSQYDKRECNEMIHRIKEDFLTQKLNKPIALKSRFDLDNITKELKKMLS